MLKPWYLFASALLFYTSGRHISNYDSIWRKQRKQFLANYLAQPDPFLPPIYIQHTHILATFPSLPNTSQTADGGGGNVHVFKDAREDTCTCASKSRQAGRSPVAKKVKRWSVNLSVPGSIPVGGADIFPAVNEVPVYSTLHYLFPNIKSWMSPTTPIP